MTAPLAFRSAPVGGEATLSALVDRASKSLNEARTAAEVIDAREQANLAYNAAKRVARIATAKRAHDDLISAALRMQADALEIEVQAKRRLADEYDAAQARGEIRGKSNQYTASSKPGAKEVGLSKRQIEQAREIRNAENRDPGIVRRTIDEALAAGEEPTKAIVKEAIRKATTSGKEKAELRRGAHNELRMRASEARSCAKFPDSKIELLKRCKDFSELVAVARKAGNAWIELANRMENFKCPPKK